MLHRLLITADAGRQQGPALRLWKFELQSLASRTGLTITVCHFYPARGTETRSSMAALDIAMPWQRAVRPRDWLVTAS
jgi:hypothetical protein